MLTSRSRRQGRGRNAAICACLLSNGSSGWIIPQGITGGVRTAERLGRLCPYIRGSRGSQAATTPEVQFRDLPGESMAINAVPVKEMRYWVTADEINRIKRDVDLPSLMTFYGLDKFKRSGSSRAVACCPFHEDHNPSLSVDGQLGLYKCFSCGAAGDVISFVREYHKVKHKEEISFVEAVKQVRAFLLEGAQQKCSLNGSVTPLWDLDNNDRVMKKKREKIYAMNQEAAAFYSECLTRPFAGRARKYLKTRGFKSLVTARAFALGYAPDVYLAKGSLPEEQKSLVLHLRDRGYNSTEILASGLGVPCTKGNQNLGASNDSFPKSMNTAMGNGQVEPALSDRFRDRLIVPILDPTGRKVAGFGGRTLSSHNGPDDTESDNLNTPKYLNSPQTAVFQKKKLLFGYCATKRAYQQDVQGISDSFGASLIPDLVVVEGYMDVLALWDVGIRTAVATMGTAISQYQLNMLGSLAAQNGGRVVFCLDNDKAGRAAVERLCSGGLLRGAACSFSVEFCIANLPEDVSDPGDYIEQQRIKTSGTQRIGTFFAEDVVDKAVNWSEWYVGRILRHYDGTNADSFGDVFVEIAGFLSTFPNAAGRIRGAFKAAKELAALLASESSTSSASEHARIQLESDLIHIATRMANFRDVPNQREEVRNSYSGLGSYKGARSTGNGLGESEKLRQKAVEKFTRGAKTMQKEHNKEHRKARRSANIRQGDGGRRQLWRGRRRHRMKQPPSLTPHFAGFYFEKQSDADWLGIPRTKANVGNRLNTLGNLQPTYDSVKKSWNEKNDLIYFNSNDFHCNSSPLPQVANLVGQGVASLIARGARGKRVSTELALLRCLIANHAESRDVVTGIPHAIASIGLNVPVKWSSQARNWLFTTLMDNDLMCDCNNDFCDASFMAVVVSKRTNTPSAAFASSELPFAVTGLRNEHDPRIVASKTPDPLFTGEPTTIFPSIFNSTINSIGYRKKASLAVHELLTNLLVASASLQTRASQEKLESVSLCLHGRFQEKDLPGTARKHTHKPGSSTLSDMASLLGFNPRISNHTGIVSMPSVESPFVPLFPGKVSADKLLFESVSRLKIELQWQKRLEGLRAAMQQRKKLGRYAKCITESLMSLSTGAQSENIEGRLQCGSLDVLPLDLDSHLEHSESVATVNEDVNEVIGRQIGTKIAVQDELAKMEKNWGEWSSGNSFWFLEKRTQNASRASETPLSKMVKALRKPC